MSQQKFKTPEELKAAIQSYFETAPFPTITGLAYYLGFASRQSFYDYENNEEYSYTIKRARLFMESVYEQGLQEGKSVAGAIFALKNFGWKDKQEIEQSGGIKIQFADPGDYIYPSQDQGDSGIPESI